MAIKINETIDRKSRKAKECRQEFTRLTNSCLSFADRRDIPRIVGTAVDHRDSRRIVVLDIVGTIEA